MTRDDGSEWQRGMIKRRIRKRENKKKGEGKWD